MEPYHGSYGGRPAERHKAITKHARQTKHIEPFNRTRGQRIARLVGGAPSCSKKLAHHIGAITYVICHDNLTHTAA